MTDKEFRYLRRIELIDIIYKMQNNEEKLQVQNAALKKQLEEKQIQPTTLLDNAQNQAHKMVAEERWRLHRAVLFHKLLLNTIAILLVVAAAAVLIATLFFPILQVSGESMEPTLKNGDVILLMKHDSFDTGDLVALRYNGKVLLKRVIGGPGDYIEIDKNGNVSVNGKEIDEPYLTEKSLGECDLTFPYQVPDNSWFVLGDHRSISVDSRSSTIGCIRTEQIIGKAILRIWPLSELGLIH